MKLQKKLAKKIFTGLGVVIAIISGVSGTIICLSISWMFRTWSNLTVDEMVYHLKAPLEGMNNGLIYSYMNECLAPAMLIFLFLILVFLVSRSKKCYYVVISTVIILPICLTFGISAKAWNNLNVGSYVKGQTNYSTFIDDNYMDPGKIDITFPVEKRNLVYIFLESMEVTYADMENGGGFEQNYITELTELAQENEDFSGKEDKLNGAYSLPGTTWTIGAMFGQTSGLPLNISIDANSMDTQDNFFEGAVTLGDILEPEGYSQSLLIGSDAAFGGRELYFTEHGGYEMMDYGYASNKGLIPENYRVWWGYEDQKLFGVAKDKLVELSEKEEPFNLTMLTADTHFEDGYLCEKCPEIYGDNTYANVVTCASSQVSEFIQWMQSQEFYENTSVVIVGDHPTMDKDFCADINQEYEQRVYTNYINPAVKSGIDSKRIYTTLDLFPTTLASLGAEIEGERLGLGTNLFSEKPTLAERFGITKLKQKVSGKSKLMEQLSNIDENKPELQIVEGAEEEQATDGTVVAAGKYDFMKGLLPVTVSLVENIEEKEAVTIAVWTEEDQSDIQWLRLELGEDSSYHTNINVPSFGFKTGEYYIEAYTVREDGELDNLGGTIGIVD